MKNGSTNGSTKLRTFSTEATNNTEQLLNLTELLQEYPTRAEVASLKGQIQIMQNTIDRHQDINKDLLHENNLKIDGMQQDIGDIKVKYLQLDIILKRITDTFSHMGTLFTEQQKEIGNTVEDSVQKAMQPVQEKVDSLTSKRVIHHFPTKKSRLSFLKFWR